MPTSLTEHIADWRTPHVEIDRDRRLVRNIALTGLASKNGYRYSEAALRDALPLYDHKPVFLDHPPAPARPHDRSTRDLAGAVINPRYEDGRIRGDVELLDTDAGRTFLALAEAEHPAVGMSHVVLADRSPDNTTVERIHDVISIDAVVFPATTRTLRESADCGFRISDCGLVEGGGLKVEGSAPGSAEPPADSPDLLAVSRVPNPQSEVRDPQIPPPNLQSAIRNPQFPPWSGPVEPLLLQLDALLPDHVARLAAVPPSRVRRAGLFSHTLLVEVTDPVAPPRYFALPWRTDGESIRLDESLTPVDTESLIAACGVALDRHIDDLLACSRLPPSFITPHFRNQLREAPNDAARQALLNDRLLLLEQFQSTHPMNQPASQSRLNPASSPLSDKSIIAAIRGR